jgi:uncharacterized protein YpmB
VGEVQHLNHRKNKQQLMNIHNKSQQIIDFVINLKEPNSAGIYVTTNVFKNVEGKEKTGQTQELRCTSNPKDET